MYIRPAAPCTLHSTDLRRLRVSNKHYDYQRGTGQYDPRRILLFAECQIGKTGAYIHLIQLLLSEVTEQVPEPQIRLSRDCTRYSELQWRFPYWQDLMRQDNIDYSYPRYGKYHEFILSQRLALLVKCVQQPSGRGWLTDYCSTIVGSGKLGELVISSEGRHRIGQLLQTYGQFEAPIRVDPGSSEIVVLNQNLLERALDWDNRLNHRYNDVRGQYLIRYLDKNLRRVQSELCKGGPNALGSTTSVQWRSWGDAGLEFVQGSNVRPVTPATCALRGQAGHPYQTRPVQLLSGMPAADQYSEYCTDISMVSAPQDQHGTPLWRFDELPRWSIPDDKRDLFHIEAGRVVRANTTGAAFSKLRVRWIFTITYNRAVPGRRHASLDRSEAMGLAREEYVEVLVVRPGAQFKNYQEYHGRTHVIMAMPSSMEISYGRENPLAAYEAEAHGCGYARAVSQIVSHCLGLECIWMIDDNVGRCWEIDPGKGEAVPCSFSQAMRGIEAIVGYSEDSDFYKLLGEDSNASRFVALPSHVVHLRPKQTNVDGDGPVVCLEDFSGKRQQYGIIGMSRDVGRRETIDKPFMVTYSVYSFFLLNVSATIDHRLIYPARTFWEDIEASHVCESSGLLVCKTNRYAHWKKAIGRADAVSITPTPADPITSLEEIVGEECCAILRLDDYYFLDADQELRQWADTIVDEWGDLQPESSTAIGLLELGFFGVVNEPLSVLIAKARHARATELICIWRKEDEQEFDFRACIQGREGSILSDTELYVVARLPIPTAGLTRAASVRSPPL